MNQPLPHQTIDWLLEPENPPVRLATLTELLNLPESDPEVISARTAVMATGPVREILDLQGPDGGWGIPRRFYIEKYRGTVWQLMILAELGADGADPRVERACEFILATSFDHGSGGFSCYRSEKGGAGLPSYVIPCLTGNMVWSLLRLGRGADPRVQRAIRWINQYQRFDDGEDAGPTGMPYDRFKMCWGSHSCHMGVVKSLKALAAIPEADRSEETRETIAQAVEYLLLHHIYKQSHNLRAMSKPGWTRLGFPLMYQTDVLEILEILTGLRIKDPRMDAALSLLASKKGPDGRWILENSFNGKFQVDIEKKGKPSKWITLKAIKVLDSYLTA